MSDVKMNDPNISRILRVHLNWLFYTRPNTWLHNNEKHLHTRYLSRQKQTYYRFVQS